MTVITQTHTEAAASPRASDLLHALIIRHSHIRVLVAGPATCGMKTTHQRPGRTTCGMESMHRTAGPTNNT
eukprot:774217-Pelagomonas_calceolata.AAC.2